MANKFLRRIWVIDTASTQVINSDEVTRITAIRWVSPTAAAEGHNLEITDAADNVLFEAVAFALNSGTAYQEHAAFDTPIELWSSGGIKVKTLDSGKVYLYLA